MSDIVLNTLRRLREEWATAVAPRTTLTDEECVALINEAAWIHAADGWGLSYKADDKFGRRYDGMPLAHDILVDRATGVEYDVLVGAGEQSTPTWGTSGGKVRPGREWVAPIPPEGVSTPVPPPVVVPPASTSLTAEDVRRAVLSALNERDKDMRAYLDVELRLIQGRLDTISALVQHQDKRREELAVHADEALVSRTTTWPLEAAGRVFGAAVRLTGTVGRAEK